MTGDGDNVIKMDDRGRGERHQIFLDDIIPVPCQLSSARGTGTATIRRYSF